MVKIYMDAELDEMLAILKSWDMWTDKFLESMSYEDLTEFGEEQGAWTQTTGGQNNG